MNKKLKDYNINNILVVRTDRMGELLLNVPAIRALKEQQDFETLTRYKTGKEDVVNHPRHYMIYPSVEAIDIIRRTLTREQFIGYLIGNSLKYRLRAGRKHGNIEEDLGKAAKYEQWLDELIQFEN